MPEDPSLRDEVLLAVTEPDSYRTQFHWRLIDRGIDEEYETDEGAFDPTESDAVLDLPWIALIDGLMERGRLVELDWKEAPDEVMTAIDHLLAGQPAEPERWTWVDLAHWEQADTESFLLAIAERLREQGRILACFSLSSDSYPLTIIDAPRFAELHQLAERTGYSLEDFQEGS
jgi:hypothetical protein